MTTREQFVIPKRYNTFCIALMAVGILAIILLYITHGSKNDAHEQSRFWASLLQNSVYFLLITNIAMFFICATTLAWGGWQMSFRRVTEAISACVPVLGIISAVILLSIVFSSNHEIYHWTDTEHVKHDNALLHKAPFLNKTFFTIWTLLTIVLWSLLGRKMRQISRSSDGKHFTVEEGRKYMWKNTVWAAIYIVFFALTMMSSLPWLWLMSIDAHWYSTMYSWYTLGKQFRWRALPDCAICGLPEK